jgi:hypothetical protein
LGRITIKDASGATIDLEALRPQAGEAISEEAAE